MTGVALRIGPITVPGYTVLRSGFRWLRPDGHVCRPGEVVAFCGIGLHPDATAASNTAPFVEEGRDLKVAVATRIGGRLRHAPGAMRGGFLDELNTFFWSDGTVIGHLEADGSPEADADDPGLLRLLMLAGRRVTDLAGGNLGLLNGWYDQSRAWWGEGAGPRGTVLGVASCEQIGILKGDEGGFLELFEGSPGPAQAVVIQVEPLVLCARVLLEGMTRTDDQRTAIREDLARTFSAGGVVPTASDWLFVGTLINALDRSPLTDGYPILQRHGLTRTPPASAVVLSTMAELRDVAQHRRLGYTVCCHDFRLRQAGPATAHWLRTHFVRVRRSTDDIRADYRALIEQLRSMTGARLLVFNTNATPAHEQIHSYAGFAKPLGETVGSIRSKELNLMLHDLAGDLDIIDVDAFVGEAGLRDHMPDGTHQSGHLQAALRAEVLRILQDRDVPGFQPRRRPSQRVRARP